MEGIDCPICNAQFEEEAEMLAHKQTAHEAFSDTYGKEDNDADQRDITNDINKPFDLVPKIPEPWEYGGSDYKREGDPDGDKAEEEGGADAPLAKVADLSEGKDDYAVYDNQQDAENQQDERKEETYEVDEDYTETCPECGKVFDNPADAGFHAVKHDTDKATKGEEDFYGKPSPDTSKGQFKSMYPKRLRDEMPASDTAGPEAETSNFDADIENDQVVQKLPDDKRSYNVENGDEQPNDDYEEHPEELEAKLEENWHRISTENRVKLFEAIGLTQADSYTLAGLDYRYLTEAVKKDIAKERHNIDLDDTTEYIGDDEEKEEDKDETDEAYEFIYNLEKNHRSRDFKKKSLICTRCNETFYRNIDRNVHFNEVHMNANEYELPDQCPFCKEMIQEPETLDWHMQEQHGAHIPSTYTQTGIQGAMADADDFGIDQDFYKESKKATEGYEVTDFFTPPEEDDMATCDICGEKIHGGDMEGMKSHLLEKHINIMNEAKSFEGIVNKFSNESRSSDLKKEIKKLTNFINIASMENPMNMGDDQAKLDSLKAELASLGESKKRATEQQVMCEHCSRTFDLRNGPVCEWCGKRNTIYESRANEHISDSWWWKETRWESGFDQDFLYCNKCGADLLAEASWVEPLNNVGDDKMNKVVPDHLRSHGITETYVVKRKDGEDEKVADDFIDTYLSLTDQTQIEDITQESYAKEDFDFDAAEPARVKLLLEQYKSGEDWVSDPPRTDNEKDGSLDGWMSYSQKFKISDQDARKAWGGEALMEACDNCGSTDLKPIEGTGRTMADWDDTTHTWEGYHCNNCGYEQDKDKVVPLENRIHHVEESEKKEFYKLIGLEFKPERQGKRVKIIGGKHPDFIGKTGEIAGVSVFDDTGVTVRVDGEHNEYQSIDLDTVDVEFLDGEALSEMQLKHNDWGESRPFWCMTCGAGGDDPEDIDAHYDLTGHGGKGAESKATEQNAERLMEDLMDEDGNPPDNLGVDDAVAYLTKMGVPEDEAKDAVRKFGGAID